MAVWFLFVTGVSCHQKRPDHPLRVTVLRGPSAIALAQWMESPPIIDGRKISLEIIDSPEKMQAMIIKKETEMAVLPMVNAANLYNKQIPYQLAGCPVWGTLFLVEKQPVRGEQTSLYVFGAGTTPDILTRYYLEKNHLQADINYSFNTPGEIVLAIRTGKVKKAVISEPFLSMLCQQDPTIRIVADLSHASGFPEGFAQTAILCSPDIKELKKIQELIKHAADFANNHPEETIRILEKKEVFPAGMLNRESIERCRIDYRTAQEARQNIHAFLSLIQQYEPHSIGGKLPDTNFIKEEK